MSPASPGPLRAQLDADTPPVFGAALGPDDFLESETGWTAQLPTADGAARSVHLEPVGAGKLRCMVDGEEIPFPDPYLQDSSRRTASAQEWLDHFRREELAAKEAPPSIWEGDSVEAMLLRAEHDVVAFDRREISVAALEGPGAVQSWLEESLADTQVSVRAIPLHGFPLRSGDRLAEGRLLCGFDGEGDPDRYYPIAVGTDVPLEPWFAGTGTPGLAPSAHLSMEGPALVASRAAYVLDWPGLDAAGVGALEGDSLGAGAGAGPGAGADGARWCVLHVVGTRFALPLPMSGATSCSRSTATART